MDDREEIKEILALPGFKEWVIEACPDDMIKSLVPPFLAGVSASSMRMMIAMQNAKEKERGNGA